MEYEGKRDITCNWHARYSHQRIDIGPRRLGNKRTCRDYLHYSFLEIGQNTEKSPGDLTRLAVTQTSLRNHRQTLV